MVRVKFRDAGCHGQERLQFSISKPIQAMPILDHTMVEQIILHLPFRELKKNAGEGDESFAVTFLLDLACGGRAVHFFSSSFFTLSHDQTRE